MMQLPELGPFVRALLPAQLTGGHTVTLGVWVSISPQDLRHAYTVWWTDAYRELVLDGRLANDVGQWPLLARPVRLRVLDADHAPYCVESSDQLVSRVLSEAWPHELLQAVFPE